MVFTSNIAVYLGKVAEYGRRVVGVWLCCFLVLRLNSIGCVSVQMCLYKSVYANVCLLMSVYVCVFCASSHASGRSLLFLF